MANEMTITVGANTATVPIPLNVSQTNAVILRYMARKGISTEGMTAQQIGEAFLRSLMRYVKDISLEMQRVELQEANLATIQTTLATDNNFVEEVQP